MGESMRGSGKGGGEKSQKYRVFSNTGQDPLKIYNAAKPAFNVGPSTACQPKAI